MLHCCSKEFVKGVEDVLNNKPFDYEFCDSCTAGKAVSYERGRQYQLLLQKGYVSGLADFFSNNR